MLNNLKQDTQPKAKRSWRQRLQTAGLLLALTVSPFGATATVVAQEVNGKTAAIAARLGVKAVDLTPQEGVQDYRSNPVASEGNLERSTSGVSDMVGTLSVQNFQGTQSTLYNTHASANGFRNYFNTWYTPNFARRDGDVSVWLYHDFAGGDNYDFWNSGGTDYGIDAVRVAFHSGHGGMSGTNRFIAPMGANWGGRGWNASSDKMRLGGNHSGAYGDERLRYLFWDTCNSVMVSGGHNPYGTWGVRSRGIRFVFGYETVSIDSPNYGKFFWEEWNKNKTLAQAFLDASWRISTGQSPSVVAFGSNQTDATNRLNTERYLSAGSVGNNWGQWRWYNARSAARATTASLTYDNQWFSQDQQFAVRNAVAQSNSPAELTAIARAFGIAVKGEQIQERQFGLRAVETKGATLVMEANGNFELILNTAAAKGASNAVLSDEELISRAQKMAAELNLFKGQQVTVGMIRDLNENGGGGEGIEHARVIEKTVIFDQMVDGLPFIDPEAGHLEITFDAHSGQTKRVRSTLQAVEAAKVDGAQASRRVSIVEARAEALAQAELQANAKQLEITAGTEAIGLQLINGKVVPVLRAEIRNPQEPFARPQLAVVPLVK